MDDLEAIRQRRLRELQEAQAAAQGQDPDAERDAQAAQQEAAIESFLQKILDSEARERLTRIRLSRPELAEQVSRQLISLAQAGRLPRRLTDADLRDILVQIMPKDRDINITRK